MVHICIAAPLWPYPYALIAALLNESADTPVFKICPRYKSCIPAPAAGSCHGFRAMIMTIGLLMDPRQLALHGCHFPTAYRLLLLLMSWYSALHDEVAGICPQLALHGCLVPTDHMLL